MGIPLPPAQKGGGPPEFLAHVYCDLTAGWMKLILGMVVGLSPGEFVLDGDPAPSPKRGKAPSPILRVVVENFEIGPEVPPPIVDACLSCEDTARQSCAMVPKWRFFASCICSEQRAAHFRHAF